jgi:hypothetical protein
LFKKGFVFLGIVASSFLQLFPVRQKCTRKSLLTIGAYSGLAHPPHTLEVVPIPNHTRNHSKSSKTDSAMMTRQLSKPLVNRKVWKSNVANAYRIRVHSLPCAHLFLRTLPGAYIRGNGNKASDEHFLFQLYHRFWRIYVLFRDNLPASLRSVPLSALQKFQFGWLTTNTVRRGRSYHTHAWVLDHSEMRIVALQRPRQ